MSLLAKGQHVVMNAAAFALLASLCAHLVLGNVGTTCSLNLKHLLARELTVHQAWLTQLIRSGGLNSRQG